MKSYHVGILTGVAIAGLFFILHSDSQANAQRSEPRYKFVGISAAPTATDGSYKLYALTENGDVYEQSYVAVERGTMKLWHKSHNIPASAASYDKLKATKKLTDE